MTKWEKSFIQGYACCMANAHILEDHSLTQINGGISYQDCIDAGVDENDLSILYTATNEKGEWK